jgi:hypothetical protein
MTESTVSSATTGWIAVAAGIACVLAVILIVLFFTLGEPFGTLNDLTNGLAGILCGLLAWVLYTHFPSKSPLLSQLSVVLAVIGALIAVAGTVLVVFNITGWVLAGFYTAVGNALIGIWLAAFGYAVQRTVSLPGQLFTFGTIAGLLMAVGIVAVAGIIARVDSMESLPWYLNLGYLGFFGTYILFPVWAIWLGHSLLKR